MPSVGTVFKYEQHKHFVRQAYCQISVSITLLCQRLQIEGDVIWHAEIKKSGRQSPIFTYIYPSGRRLVENTKILRARRIDLHLNVYPST